MRTVSVLLALFAAANISLQAPVLAFAGDVQPVPYNPSQPVPVGAPPPPPQQQQQFAPPGGQGAGTDVIYLKGGGMLRGRMIEIIPNDHATIALATGQNAIVQWNRIDRIEQQPMTSATPPPPPPGPGYGAPPPPPPGPRGKVWVHMEGPTGLTLAGRDASGLYQPMCESPCDKELPLDTGYRIQGSGVRNSREFMLQAQPGQRIVLNVKAGSKASFTGGIVLVSTGPVVIFIGLIVLLVGAAQNSVGSICDSGTGTCNNGSPGKGTETTGGIMTLIGVGATVAGGVLIGTNARTSVTEELLQPGQQVGALPTRREDAWLRAPVWHDVPSYERAIPTPQTVPIFSRAF